MTTPTDDQLTDIARSVFLRSPNGRKVLEHLREMFYDRSFEAGINLEYQAGQHSVVRYILDCIEGDPQ